MGVSFKLSGWLLVSILSAYSLFLFASLTLLASVSFSSGDLYIDEFSCWLLIFAILSTRRVVLMTFGRVAVVFVIKLYSSDFRTSVLVTSLGRLADWLESRIAICVCCLWTRVTVRFIGLAE